MNDSPVQKEPPMVLTKKQGAELSALIDNMTQEQLEAHFIDITERLLPSLDLGALQSARDKFATLAAEKQEAQRDKVAEELKQQYDAMMAKAVQLGLNLPNVLGITPPARRAKPSMGAETANGDGRQSVEIQIRNPKDHTEKWSLRGQKPRWLIRELAAKGINADKIKNSDIPAEYWVKNQ